MQIYHTQTCTFQPYDGNESITVISERKTIKNISYISGFIISHSWKHNNAFNMIQ